MPVRDDRAEVAAVIAAVQAALPGRHHIIHARVFRCTRFRTRLKREFESQFSKTPNYLEA